MQFSENSRVWIYQANRPFNNLEVDRLQVILNGFASQWMAHGNQLAARAEIRYNRFILFIVDESKATVTGCSIDKSVSLIKQVEQEFSVSLFDRFNIAYREDDGIRSCGRDEFENLLAASSITEDTIVFNNLVQTLSQLNNEWEVPLKNSWHARVFGNLIRI